MQKRNLGKALISIAIVSLLSLALTGCGGGGSTNTAALTHPIATVAGTVPGTLIEAFCDNGSYYSVNSTQNGTSQHPFSLDLPAGVGCRLVMTTNEGTAQAVVAPIGFLDANNVLNTRLTLPDNSVVDLGFIPLPMSPAAAGSSDADSDGVLDAPFILDNYTTQANNPLKQIDTNHDGINDWADPAHSGQHYAANTKDPLDIDGDGVPNSYDSDFTPAANDIDKDGISDNMDANPTNQHDANHQFEDDANDDGYHDTDMNHDGYPDDSAPQGPGSTAPVANAGIDQNVIVGALVTLDGSASLNSLTYLWTLAGTPAGSSAILSSTNTVTSSFTPDVVGTYTLNLVVNDGTVNSLSDTMTVTVTDPTVNAAPVAIAGSNQSVTTGAVVALDGSGSSDPNSDPLTYSWSIMSSPAGSTATLSSATVVNPSFTADMAGTYSVQLVVNDGTVNSLASTVTITAAAAVPAINGGALYNSKCFGCHGTLGRRSSAQITTAISNIGSMNQFSTLSTAEIDAISLYLGP